MKIKRKNIPSGAPWESVAGYSRAVRIGPWLEITGTVATEGGRAMHLNDPAGQTHFILDKIKRILENEGGSLEDVIRTRIYVTDIKEWETIGKVHGKYFSKILPATTMVEVSGLIHPDYLVEIEARAYIHE